MITIPAGRVRDTFIPRDVADRINALGNITWNPFSRQFSREELRESIRNVDVCITGWGTPRLDQYVLEGAKNLKLVAHTGGTVYPIVSDYLYDKGIKVISGNKIYAESVAEGVIAYILCSLRDLIRYANEMQIYGWSKDDYYNEGLLDQTVGLVGFGAVARALTKMLRPFRAKIKVYDPYVDDSVLAEYGVQPATLEEIFTTCKIISIHAAQRPENKHMISAELLRLIPEGSLFINTARGSIVDEEALAQELQKGRFKAVLDVFEIEPLPMSSKLRGLPNVILIPHMAGPTVDRRKIVTLELLKDIENFFKGEPLRYEIPREYAMRMTT